MRSSSCKYANWSDRQHFAAASSPFSYPAHDRLSPQAGASGELSAIFWTPAPINEAPGTVLSREWANCPDPHEIIVSKAFCGSSSDHLISASLVGIAAAVAINATDKALSGSLTRRCLKDYNSTLAMTQPNAPFSTSRASIKSMYPGAHRLNSFNRFSIRKTMAGEVWCNHVVPAIRKAAYLLRPGETALTRPMNERLSAVDHRLVLTTTSRSMDGLHR